MPDWFGDASAIAIMGVLMWRMIDFMGNHVKHNTESTDALKAANEHLADTIETLAEAVQGCPYQSDGRT